MKLGMEGLNRGPKLGKGRLHAFTVLLEIHLHAFMVLLELLIALLQQFPDPVNRGIEAGSLALGGARQWGWCCPHRGIAQRCIPHT